MRRSAAARQGRARRKGAVGPRPSPETRWSETRPAMMASTLLPVVEIARVVEMPELGRFLL